VERCFSVQISNGKESKRDKTTTETSSKGKSKAENIGGFLTISTSRKPCQIKKNRLINNSPKKKRLGGKGRGARKVMSAIRQKKKKLSQNDRGGTNWTPALVPKYDKESPGQGDCYRIGVGTTLVRKAQTRKNDDV